MKFLLMILILSCSQVFAQGYFHAYDNRYTCNDKEDCLIHLSYDNVIKMIPLENAQGEIWGHRLSSESTLSDTVFKGARLCFKGAITNICNMLSLMANMESEGYYGHGHSLVEDFQCIKEEEYLKLNYTLMYDMSPKAEHLEFKIYACE